MKEWIKRNILQLIIILGFLVFGVVTCKNKGWMGNIPQKPDTTYVTKTEYVAQPPVYIPTYSPQQSSSVQPIIIPSQYQPSQDLTTLVKQYQELANKFLAQNTYKDSILLKDSTGKQVGVVSLDDMVSENQIKSRKPSYQLTFPVTTNTLTITKYAPNKTKFYVGANISGGRENVLNQVGIGLIYSSKKYALWQLKANYNFQGGISYELGRYWKLSLRK